MEAEVRDGARRRADRAARRGRAAHARPAHGRDRAEDPSDLRAQIAKQLGAEYVCVANKALPDVPKETGFPDIVIEGDRSVARGVRRDGDPRARTACCACCR
jgi:hypothetical protein